MLLPLVRECLRLKISSLYEAAVVPEEDLEPKPELWSGMRIHRYAVPQFGEPETDVLTAAVRRDGQHPM